LVDILHHSWDCATGMRQWKRNASGAGTVKSCSEDRVKLRTI